MSIKIGYTTEKGKLYHGKIEEFLQSEACHEYKGKINLIFTSPPFPLNRKKNMGI